MSAAIPTATGCGCRRYAADVPAKRRKRREFQSADRDYRTFLEFCRINGITQWTRLDTVIGRVGGKVLFTVILSGGVLMFLRDRKFSQTCTRLFNVLREVAGPDLFQKLFRVILTGDGSGFFDLKQASLCRMQSGKTVAA